MAGQSQSPWEVATSTVPTNGTVQVKLVKVKVKPISKAGQYPFPLLATDNFVKTLEGILISKNPNRLMANPTNIAVIRRLTQGLAANWLIPVAPRIAASPIPRPVNVKMMPRQ